MNTTTNMTTIDSTNTTLDNNSNNNVDDIDTTNTSILTTIAENA